MGILDFGGDSGEGWTVHDLHLEVVGKESRSQSVIPKTPTPITHASMIFFSTTNPIHNQHPAIQNQEKP